MQTLAKVMRKYKLDVILQQEIHGMSKSGIKNLHSFLPNYNWNLNWGPKQKKGVGVGVRNNTSTTFPLNEAYTDKEANIIAVDLTLRGRDCRVISVYRPRKTLVEKLLEPHMKMMKTYRDLVITGDFNIDKDADTFQPFQDSLEEKCLVHLDWDSPHALAGREH
jgi:exonuclease III